MTHYSVSCETGWKKDVERPSMWLGWAQVRKNVNCLHSVFTCTVNAIQLCVKSGADPLKDFFFQAALSSVK